MQAAVVAASLSLLIASIVAIKVVPYLARRTALERWMIKVEYEFTREGVVYFVIIMVITIAALNTGNNLLFIILANLLSGDFAVRNSFRHRALASGIGFCAAGARFRRTAFDLAPDRSELEVGLPFFFPYRVGPRSSGKASASGLPLARRRARFWTPPSTCPTFRTAPR